MPDPSAPRIQWNLPGWIDPAKASPDDYPGQGVLRQVAGILGFDDPNTAVFGMAGGEVKAGEMAGGAIEALAQRFPRFAAALKQYSVKAPTEGMQIADSIKPSGAGYELRAPIKRRFEKMYQLGDSFPEGYKSNWDETQARLLDAFGGDERRMGQYLRIIGATSPGNSVPGNTADSVKVFNWVLTHPNQAATEPVLNSLHVGNAPSKVANVNNAIAGRPLSGDKVEAFAQYMLGQERIPIDRHAIYAGNGFTSKEVNLDSHMPALRKLMVANEGQKLSNSEIYARLEGAMASALREIAPDVPFNSKWGTLWEGVRGSKRLAPQGDPIKILDARGLIKTAAMLDPEQLTAVLKKAKWSLPAIGAVIAASHGTPEVPAEGEQ